MRLAGGNPSRRQAAFRSPPARDTLARRIVVLARSPPAESGNPRPTGV